MTSSVPDLPAGWRVLRTRGPVGFVTHAVLARPDGTEVEWTSRRHRKGLGLRLAGVRAEGGRASAMSWWIGSLFAVGSFCFALGSVPAYFDAVDPALVAATFFVGSIFFTSAGYLQFHEVLRAPGGVLVESPRPRRLASLVGWKPRRIDFWAVLVQLVGTVFFNISTFAATQSDLTTEQAKRLVWAPDVYGSICFLVASWLAYSEVNRGDPPALGPLDGLADLRAEHAGVDRLRRVRGRVPLPALDRRAGQSHAGEPRDVRRRRVLPARCRAAPGGVGEGPVVTHQPSWCQTSSSGWRGAGRNVSPV